MHQFTFDADKGRTQIEACERLPVGARNTSVTQRTSAGDNSADQTTCSIKIFHAPLIGLTEQAIYTFKVVPFPLELIYPVTHVRYADERALALALAGAGFCGRRKEASVHEKAA